MFAATVGPAISRPTGTDAGQTHYRDCVLQSRRDPEKAYNQALEWHKNGGGGASRHCAALALVGMGRYEDAATVLEELADDVQISDTATRIGAKSGDALRAALLSQAGNAWLMAKQFRSARATLTKALKYVAKRSPSACDILIDRARASAGEKNFDRALNDLDEAMDIDPTRPEIYVYRASAWRETNQMDLASKDIERALQMEPGDVDALLERGYIRQRQEQPLRRPGRLAEGDRQRPRIAPGRAGGEEPENAGAGAGPEIVRSGSAGVQPFGRDIRIRFALEITLFQTWRIRCRAKAAAAPTPPWPVPAETRLQAAL